ncbi:MAG: FAD-binding domain-containing protein [Pseudomonadota bacterium]
MGEAPTKWAEATRDAALTEMAAFRSRMGRRYASGRNFDLGPGQHKAVSCLSPYVRRRLVLEEELVDIALAGHGLEGAEKFIQEVFWRGYFKGWLERRPSVWRAYRDGLGQDLAALGDDRKLAKRISEAEEGRTGLDCFDAWAEELVSTGYLHNHARMWFASIWIFTLELPWRLGADFFYRHLLDGDPASNTLSWRWVGGLHTRGKVYQAQAWNIAKFTNQRFTPRDADLAAHAGGLDATEPEGLPDAMPMRVPREIDPERPSVLLITEEDCQPESWPIEVSSVRSVAVLRAGHLRSERPVSPKVVQFEDGALADAVQRLSTEAEWLEARDPGVLVKWAKSAGATQIVTGYVPEGPLGDWVREAEVSLEAQGIVLAEHRRNWDAAIWPHATAGFFKVKKRIPRILRALGLEDLQPRLL